MPSQPGSNNYAIAVGSSPENVEVPTYQTRAPAATDVNWSLGKRWLFIGTGEYVLASLTNAGGTLVANWTLLGTNGGPLNTLTGDSGGALTPSSNNINILGTANQVTTTGSGATLTLSTPATFVAPGSIAATTSVTATLGNITATNGNFVKGTAGNKDVYTSLATTTAAGANSAGTVTLAGGTATVATTAVTAASKIRIYRQGIGATGVAALGALTIGTIVANTSFVINAVESADATGLQVTDVSVVFWEIVN